MSGGLIRNYSALRVAFTTGRKAMGVSQLEMDELAGLQSGYTGKLECGMKHLGDLSMPKLLAALKMALLLVPDDGSAKQAAKHLKKPVVTEAYRRIRKIIGAKGGRAAAFNMTKRALRQRARNAALTRWKREKQP